MFKGILNNLKDKRNNKFDYNFDVNLINLNLIH